MAFGPTTVIDDLPFDIRRGERFGTRRYRFDNGRREVGSRSIR